MKVRDIMLVLIAITMLMVYDVESSSHDVHLECLALNIYHEAAGEPLIGQVAVAYVTLNRVAAKGWRSTVCGVVYQPDAFSWTDANKAIEYPDDYEVVYALAKEVLYGDTYFDPTEGATFYHNLTTEPCWLPDVEKTVRIDNHIFYRDTGKRSGGCYAQG